VRVHGSRPLGHEVDDVESVTQTSGKKRGEARLTQEIEGEPIWLEDISIDREEEGRAPLITASRAAASWK
jgi:hypothetical protein